VCSAALVFEETFAQTVFVIVSSAVPGLSKFYSPVCLFVCLFLCTTLGVRHSRRTPAKLEHHNRQDIRAEPQFISAVVTCAVPGLSVFYSLVVSIWQLWMCVIPGSHLLVSTACIQKDIRADCFCSCNLRCCMAECVLLLGFNVQSDLFTVISAWSYR